MEDAFQWHFHAVEVLRGLVGPKALAANVGRLRLVSRYSGMGGAEMCIEHLLVAMQRQGITAQHRPEFWSACDKDAFCRKALMGHCHQPTHLHGDLLDYLSEEAAAMLDTKLKAHKKHVQELSSKIKALGLAGDRAGAADARASLKKTGLELLKDLMVQLDGMSTPFRSTVRCHLHDGECPFHPGAEQAEAGALIHVARCG